MNLKLFVLVAFIIFFLPFRKSYSQGESQEQQKQQNTSLFSPVQALAPDKDFRFEADLQERLKVYHHRMNYLITGDPDTKLQLSFKVRPIERVDLFLAYTQLMFWELGQKDSSPFSDLNYNPEMFYRIYKKTGILRGANLGIYEHRSNGRDRSNSRSWDRSYFEVLTEMSFFGSPLRWNTKFFTLYNLDDTNKDIQHTLGFIDAEFALIELFPQWLNDGEFFLRILPGGKLDLRDARGAQEYGFRFRVPIDRFNPFIYFQIYNGFSESQLFYDENRTTYRIGFSI